MCRLADLEVRRGVAALVHGQAVAIFRTEDDQVSVSAPQDGGRLTLMAAPSGPYVVTCSSSPS